MLNAIGYTESDSNIEENPRFYAATYAFRLNYIFLVLLFIKSFDSFDFLALGIASYAMYILHSSRRLTQTDDET